MFDTLLMMQERQRCTMICRRQQRYYFDRAEEARGISEGRWERFNAMKEAAEFIAEQIETGAMPLE